MLLGRPRSLEESLKELQNVDGIDHQSPADSSEKVGRNGMNKISYALSCHPIHASWYSCFRRLQWALNEHESFENNELHSGFY